MLASNSAINKGEASIKPSPSANSPVSSTQEAKVNYRPVPMQPVHKKSSSKPKELSTERTNFKFDINEAANREAEKARMNKSIMNQLQEQEMATTPKSRLPRKLQERERKQDSNNRDIEHFFGEQSFKISPGKQASMMTASPTKITDFKRDEAYQTMVAFKKSPELTLTNAKLPAVKDSRKLPDSEQKTMHKTMTEIVKPFTPKEQESHSPYNNRESGLSGTVTTNVGQDKNPLQTTLFGSEDFNLRERAN